MKKTVLTFGLISGAIMMAMMVATIPFLDKIGMDKGMIVGYTTIVLSFLLVFFGIRSYRDNVNGGTITFGRAFMVGILITLISSALYVITWEIMYFGIPGFADRFFTMCVNHVKSAGYSPEVTRQELQKITNLRPWLDNPLINAAVTFTEPFPIGLIITLISSAILRKRQAPPTTERPAVAAAA